MRLGQETFSQLIKKLPAFWFIAAFTTARHFTMLNHINPRPSILFLLRSILIISFHQFLGLPSALCPSGFPLYQTPVQIVTSLIIQFRPAPCHFLPLKSMYLPQYRILEHPLIANRRQTIMNRMVTGIN